MRIAICDDEKSCCIILQQILQKYSVKYSLDIDTDSYYNGEELLEALKTVTYAFLFLDIDLGSINGVEIGRYIRETLADNFIQIIYISSYESYAMQLFQIRPMDFLIKPVKYEAIERLLLNGIPRLLNQRNVFSFRADAVMYYVKYSDILYFESNNKKVTIVFMESAQVTSKVFTSQLADIINVAPNNMFLNIHKSYLVNYLHVSKYSYGWLVLTNNDKLAISKTNRKKVRDEIMHFHLQEDS